MAAGLASANTHKRLSLGELWYVGCGGVESGTSSIKSSVANWSSMSRVNRPLRRFWRAVLGLPVLGRPDEDEAATPTPLRRPPRLAGVV